jgi:hypothetical protein
MTIIVGVKCTDGVVIGADSIATSASGVTPIMRLESNDKIRIFNNKVIVSATGAVGYTQRLHYQIDKAINGGGFLSSKRDERAKNISKRFIVDLQASMAPCPPPHGIGFGALMATEIDGDPCLIEFATDNFQPEYKEKKLFFVSMGSGQPLADPFLAFVSRVLWKNTLPDVKIGRFGLYWALRHTLTYAPGLVGPPIRLATLSKRENAWVASETDDYQEAEEFIAIIEARIGASISEPAQETSGEPAPVLGPA